MPADPLSNRNIDVGWKNINPKGQLSGVKMVASRNSSSPGASSDSEQAFAFLVLFRKDDNKGK